MSTDFSDNSFVKDVTFEQNDLVRDYRYLHKEEIIVGTEVLVQAYSLV